MTHALAGQPCNCGERGWMPSTPEHPVEHIPIAWGLPAANRRTDMHPQLVVDHIMQGYLRTLVDWTRTGASKVIVHFGIGRDGRTVQMHPIYSPGVHASTRALNERTAERVRALPGTPNAYSIGIEHEGCSVDPRPDYTVPAAMIYSRSNPWSQAMVDASIAVKRWIFAEAGDTLGGPSRDSIIGHYETGDPNRVNDPAAASDRSVWPVAHMIAALTARPTLTAEQLQLLEWLETQHALGDSNRQRLLRDAGLPPAAQLADYAPASGSAPSSEAPKQEAPAPQPTEPPIDRAAVRRHLDAIDVEIAAVRRLVGPA